MKATLTYHSLDDSGSPISVSPEVFTTHLRWLSSGTVRVMPLSELRAHPETGADAVALTFDDGFLNIRDAVERVVGAGLPATIFVVTRRVGETNDWDSRPAPGIPTLPLLDWKDLEQLAAKGVAVEAHTRTHRSLTKLSLGEIDAELSGCRDELAARLGVLSTHFAYPYGDVDNVVADRASRLYNCGYTTDFRTMGRSDAPMLLPRLDMYYFRKPGAIEGWGSQKFSCRLAGIRMRRAIAARLKWSVLESHREPF